jgi:4-hydroxy-tetrahydrodipicolinate synthase
MYRAFASGDNQSALNIHYALLPLIRTVYVRNHPALVKKAAAISGIPCGKTRAPLGDPTPKQVEKVKQVLLRLKDKISISNTGSVR